MTLTSLNLVSSKSGVFTMASYVCCKFKCPVGEEIRRLYVLTRARADYGNNL
jgi:hypothetical protein